VPILRDAPGAQSLSVSGAIRLSDYSTVGELTTYKGGLEWSPIEQLKIRGSYAKASRAPSVFELFQAGDTNSPTVTDPCALIRPTGAPQVVSAETRVICQLSGLPSPGTLAVQSNSQVTSSRVGNANLKQEDGKTVTAGVVWQPPYIRGFSATLDYYDIKVSNYIARLAGGEASQVAACFGSGVTNASQYAADINCANITRQSNGDLLITAPLVNTGELTTDGFDVALNYTFSLEAVGRFTLRADGAYMNSYALDGNEYVAQTSTDFGTLPKLRTNLRVVYDRGPFQASANWQRIGKVDTRPGDSQDGNDVAIGAWSYLDLAGRYRFGSDENIELALAVTNVTDKVPPLILTGFTNTNTDNATYDSIGRRYVVSVSAKF
jgi:iron complex outermembrane recepter protein